MCRPDEETLEQITPMESVGPVRYIMELVDNLGHRLDVKQDSQPFKIDPKVSPTVLEIIETRTAQAAPKPPKSGAGKRERSFGVSDESNLSSLNVKTSRVRILSSKLINALRSVVKYYPGQSLIGDTLEFPAPYQFLVHHRHDLERYKAQHPPQHDQLYQEECNEHIDHLLEFLQNTMGKELKEEEERHKRGVATFEYLWLLLKPGQDVFVNDSLKGRLQSAVLENVEGGYQDGEATDYRGVVWSVVYIGEGDRLYRLYHNFFIQPFDGEREIQTQWVYPVEFHVDTPEALKTQNGLKLAEQMVIWGEKYWGLTKRCLKDYHGKTYQTRNDRTIDGKVMVDFEAYTADRGSRYRHADSDSDTDSDDDDGDSKSSRRGKRMVRRLRLEKASVGKGWSCECENCICKDSPNHSTTFYNYDSVDPSGEPPNRSHYFFLCSRDVLAFALRDREFVILDISHIEDPQFDSKAFSYLVLEKNIKQTIESLALDNYQKKLVSSKKQFSADFIKGKGEGQVFLLHGGPGVGKTATAECVAELTERPLLSLTSGDLGTTASKFETQLDKYLRLGERWGAIVLIDEADIYLEKRDLTDIRRNGLVAVLLRALEYYQGILFLTTNRVGVFDEAFISRIHVPLFFKDLTDSDRKRIWLNNFTRLQKEMDIEVPDPVITYATSDEKILQLKWNGREIRNAFQTAVALAESTQRKSNQRPVLAEEHISQVVDLATHFRQYIDQLNNGNSQAMLAGMNKLRLAEEELFQNVGKAHNKSPLSDGVEWTPNSMVDPTIGFPRR